MAQILIAAGADTNAKPAQIHGKTALQAAASTGDREMVQILINPGADINAEPARERGRTALQAAAESGFTELVRLLLNRGADVNAAPAQISGLCVLQAAVLNGSTEIVQLLLDSHIDLQAQGGPGLAQAIHHGKFAITRLLLSSGIDVNAACKTWSSGKTWNSGYGHSSALELAFRRLSGLTTPEDTLAMIMLLLNHGANDKSRALILAVANGYFEIVEVLCSFGADVNFVDSDWDDRTALGEAASFGNIEMVRFLLDHGANGRSRALQEAALGGHKDVVQLLISEGAGINAAPFLTWDGTPRTTLQSAAEKGKLELVRFLLNAGALPDLEPSPHEEGTALQFAAIGGHIDIVYELLQQGADVNAAARGDDGRTALEAGSSSRNQGFGIRPTRRT